ncbi:unnamed protein product [Dovyalis caffra]|uniref:Uncharacterized protein n=1 Tax=Dovyalis caffra TaxID=77055 RepID=A0AAV1SEL6_9ROSI|nr:unnamed protein product [Dovyalis caffra]
MGEWIYLEFEKLPGKSSKTRDNVVITKEAVHLIAKRPLEPNVRLHEAPGASTLHIASPAGGMEEPMHLLAVATAYVQFNSAAFETERPIFPGCSFLTLHRNHHV